MTGDKAAAGTAGHVCSCLILGPWQGRMEQHHSMFGIGRDLCGSSSPTPCQSRVPRGSSDPAPWRTELSACCLRTAHATPIRPRSPSIPNKEQESPSTLLQATARQDAVQHPRAEMQLQLPQPPAAPRARGQGRVLGVLPPPETTPTFPSQADTG